MRARFVCLPWRRRDATADKVLQDRSLAEPADDGDGDVDHAREQGVPDELQEVSDPRNQRRRYRHCHAEEDAVPEDLLGVHVLQREQDSHDARDDDARDVPGRTQRSTELVGQLGQPVGQAAHELGLLERRDRGCDHDECQSLRYLVAQTGDARDLVGHHVENDDAEDRECELGDPRGDRHELERVWRGQYDICCAHDTPFIAGMI